MTDVRLSFLDRIRIVRGGEEVTAGVLPRKLVALLGILSTERSQSSSVDRICCLLWPEVGELHARKSLNQLLVRGRQLLPGVLERPTEQLLGLSAAVTSDVHDLLFGEPFKSQVGLPSHASFEFLPGFSIRGCAELNDFLDATRTLVRARAARAALERVHELVPAAALSWATLAYRLDCADERIAAAYIRSLGAVQGPAAAWAAFTEHRRWLADELDITPSARLTASAAEACRQPGVIQPVAAGMVPAPALHPPRTRAIFRPARRLEVLVGAGALVILSAVAWRTMRTAAVEAGTPGIEVAVNGQLAGTAIGDSAIRLASAHLALHGVAAEVIESDGAIALRLAVPEGRGRRAERLSIAPQPAMSVDRLAAALADSALRLVDRGGRPPRAAANPSGGAAGKMLREAHGALAQARELIATGGASAALVMLERADSLAVRASRTRSREWQAYALRAEIANQTFWHGLAAGQVDPGILQRGIATADTAVQRGGAAEALKARAALQFTLWVFGAKGADHAGKSAQLDYAAIAAASPADGEAWTRLAQLYHADGRLSDAYAAALQALPAVTGPERMDAFMELFLAALDRQDYRTAKHWCSELAFHHGDSWLAAACSAMYAWADPASPDRMVHAGLFQETTGLRPSLESQLALFNAGADLARGDDSAAARKIGLARPLVDRDPEVAIIWAGILVELGRPDSAMSTLRAYVRGAPSRQAVIGRPWLRPLYRPNESWQEFSARLSAEPAGPSGGERGTPSASPSSPLEPSRRPPARDASDD